MLIAFFALFVVVILALVLLDLGVFSRGAHVIGLREALLRTLGWVSLSLLFNVLVYQLYGHDWLGFSSVYGHDLSGPDAALQYFTGYLLELSLSVDNMFVIATIFAYFQVPLAQQHRVLFWGILGALILRGVMIALGAVLIARFSWTVYVFGVIVILTAIKMLVSRLENIHPERNLAVRLARQLYPVEPNDTSGHFFVHRADGRLAITPVFLALLLIETSDVMFAVDSIPAIFAVTKDPFIVFTSNVFAICGLRSLYFALAGLMDKFRYLKVSLVFLLAYIGVKMILTHHYPIPTAVSLAIIGGILAVGVGASLVAPPRAPDAPQDDLLHDLEEVAVITYKQARRLVIFVVGLTILLLGLVMIFTPGPGGLFVFLGLGVLAIEFAWARVWLTRLKKAAGASVQFVKGKISSTMPKKEGNE